MGVVRNNGAQAVDTPAHTRDARRQNPQRQLTAQRTRHGLDRKVHLQRAKGCNAGSSGLSTSGLLTVVTAPLLRMRSLQLEHLKPFKTIPPNVWWAILVSGSWHRVKTEGMFCPTGMWQMPVKITYQFVPAVHAYRLYRALAPRNSLIEQTSTISYHACLHHT